MKYKVLWFFAFLVVSCAPQPTPDLDFPVTSPPTNNMSTDKPAVNPFAPKPGDENLTHGEVFIDEASLMIRESFPPQVSLSLRGNLPTPCHELRVKIDVPDQENKIMAEAYSLTDPDKACTQVLEPFEEYVDLGTFPAGHYSVWVNGEVAGEFDT